MAVAAISWHNINQVKTARFCITLLNGYKFMTPLIKKKLLAFATHITLSALIILTFLAIVWFFWYPQPFFEIEGVLPIALMMVAVDIIIGPLLTFIVFNPDKKELYFDLSVIVLVQIAAFGYGGFTIYQQRPLYITFYEDRFSLIPAASINLDELVDQSLKNTVFDKPRFVYVQIPTTTKERIELINKLSKEKKDINLFPKYYRPYQAHVKEILSSHFRLNLAFILAAHPEQKAVITDMAQGLPIETLIYYPLQGSMKKQVLVLKPSDGSMLGSLNIDI